MSKSDWVYWTAYLAALRQRTNRPGLRDGFVKQDEQVCIDEDKNQVILTDGSRYNAVLQGNPKTCDAGVKLNSKAYVVQAANNSVVWDDAPAVNGYILTSYIDDPGALPAFPRYYIKNISQVDNPTNPKAGQYDLPTNLLPYDVSTDSYLGTWFARMSHDVKELALVRVVPKFDLVDAGNNKFATTLVIYATLLHGITLNSQTNAVDYDSKEELKRTVSYTFPEVSRLDVPAPATTSTSCTTPAGSIATDFVEYPPFGFTDFHPLTGVVSYPTEVNNFFSMQPFFYLDGTGRGHLGMLGRYVSDAFATARWFTSDSFGNTYFNNLAVKQSTPTSCAGVSIAPHAWASGLLYMADYFVSGIVSNQAFDMLPLGNVLDPLGSISQKLNGTTAVETYDAGTQLTPVQQNNVLGDALRDRDPYDGRARWIQVFRNTSGVIAHTGYQQQYVDLSDVGHGHEILYFKPPMNVDSSVGQEAFPFVEPRQVQDAFLIDTQRTYERFIQWQDTLYIKTIDDRKFLELVQEQVLDDDMDPIPGQFRFTVKEWNAAIGPLDSVTISQGRQFRGSEQFQWKYRADGSTVKTNDFMLELWPLYLSSSTVEIDTYIDDWGFR